MLPRHFFGCKSVSNQVEVGKLYASSFQGSVVVDDRACHGLSHVYPRAPFRISRRPGPRLVRDVRELPNALNNVSRLQPINHCKHMRICTDVKTIHICICTYMFVCLFVCLFIYSCEIETHTYAHTHMYVYMYIYIHIHTYICSCLCVCALRQAACLVCGPGRRIP